MLTTRWVLREIINVFYPILQFNCFTAVFNAEKF